MKKKVFISYSRKDALDIAEFRSITKYRDFEILIDDEEITFNQPWKENIVNKINQSDAAILFISKNALNPESPIRSLEIPLIAKRSRDKLDNFNFFPIFLEEVGKELDEYSFTTIREGKEVNFLEIFQVLDIEKQNTLSNQSRRKRKRFFRNINANISHVLKGGTLSPGQNLITQLSRKQKLRWALASILIVFGIGWFTTTDAYARVLIAAYEQRIADGTVSEDSVTVRFLADQLNSVENLDELTTDEVLKESITEIAELNINLDVNTDLQNIDLSSNLESTSTTIGSTSTTIGSTSTTIGSTSTTIGSTSTTIVDTNAPTFTKALTATNITAGKVDISWKASDNIGISYYVLREGSFIIYQGTNTFKEVEGLISNKSYTFSVDAYDKAGNFSSSDVTFKTLPTTTTTSTTTTTVPTTTTLPLMGKCSKENYSQYENLPSNLELLVVWMRVDSNCNQNSQPGGGPASAYCFNCGHPFGGASSNDGIWVWSHMYTADGNHAGIGSGGIFNPITRIWSFPSIGLSYLQGECTGGNGCNTSDSYSKIISTTTTTTTTVPTTTTSTTTTTTTTLPTTIGPTLNSLSISEDRLFENDQLTYNYSASPGTLDWGGNERIYFELSNGYVSPKVYCNIWKGSNVSSGSYSYQLSNSSDCSQNGRYFLDKVKVRAGISNPAEITYDLLTGLVSCDSNWLNYSSEPCPSSHSFSRYNLSPFYNTGENYGLDFIAYQSCSINNDGTYDFTIRAVQISGGPSYWNVYYSTDNNETKTYFEVRTLNDGSEYTYTISNINAGLRIITTYQTSKNPYFFLMPINGRGTVLNNDNCS